VVSAAVSAVLFLPLVPVRNLADTPIVAINYDAGETVGWPVFIQTIAGVYASLPVEERADTIVLAHNYGEAGAVDRYGPDLGLPRVYSGHNTYYLWGPPPESSGTTLVIGYNQDQLRRWFGSVELSTRIDNGVGLDNDEQGTSIWVCRDRLAPWTQLWPDLRRYG
jgi:hypothetical protein